MARRGPDADSGNAVHQSAGEWWNGDHGADHLLLCADPLPITQSSIHQLSGNPITTQLFILLLLAYFIYICGKFLEGFYDRTDITIAYITKNIYNMFAIAVFIIVLWRHYQKEACKHQITQWSIAWNLRKTASLFDR